MSGLFDLRQRLDEIDQRIAESVSQRFEVIRLVGELKRDTGLPMMQLGRVETVFARAAQLEIDLGIPLGTLTTIYSKLVTEACRLEDEIIANEQQ